MSRPWVKLSTAIYRHPDLGLVSDSAWRRYLECVALAGDVDDDGRLGSWAGVARQLYVSEERLRADVAELSGRIVDRDGELWVRDWRDYQPPSRKAEPRTQVTARKQAQRSRAAVTQPSRIRDAGVSRSGHAPLEVEVEEEIDVEQEIHVGLETTVSREDQRTQPTPQSADADPWRGLEEAVRASYGGKTTRNKRTGQRLAWIGNIIRVLGAKSGDDPAVACAMWRDWWAATDPQFRSLPANAADRLAALDSRNGQSQPAVRF